MHLWKNEFGLSTVYLGVALNISENLVGFFCEPVIHRFAPSKLSSGLMDYLETTKRFMCALNVRNISVDNKQTNVKAGCVWKVANIAPQVK
jgi:hypothetical protein